ncbi:hypothetical protein [Actinomadura sp. GTD37]|uniref:hypothetical protein n=1 Tax=Actinomadura sp. GTD37 TaxID=1778030 RepID=UPI0035BFD3EF
MTTPYFADLAERLRGSGLPEAEVAGTIDDLAAYAAESGADPEEEFGTPEEFAARLVQPGAEPGPGSSAETWTWTADAFQDRRMLDRFGDEGWEVERIDAAGRFVCRRDGDHPLRWEYRRETVLPGRGDALVRRLAPDGWEPCGSWILFGYFKRPKAVVLGLEGDLGLPPEAAPSRRFFWSRRFYLFLACYVGYIAAVSLAWAAFAPDGSRSSFLGGFLVGAIIVAVIMGLRLWRGHRSRQTR